MSVRKARELVLAEGHLPEESLQGIRPEVANSWRRSILSGAHLQLSELPYVGEADIQNALCRAAEPVLSRLASRLSGLGAGVLLADRHARILRRWVSDPKILPMLDLLRSDAGFTGSEELVGTNGIGTVAETGQPIQIIGHEHLSESMVPFACVGVPVHHPITKRLEGVITMSCRAESASELLTPLMMSAAADVEHRMLEQTSHRERLVLDAYLSASKGGTRRVAGIGQDIFMAGPRVTQLLSGMHQIVLWEAVRDMLGGRSEATSQLSLADGLSVPITCRPIESQGQIVGALVDFAQPQEGPRVHVPSTESIPRRKAGSLPGLAGASAAWNDAVATVRRLAPGDQPILVAGEVGVGKWTLLQMALRETDSNIDIEVCDCADPQYATVAEANATLDGVLLRRPSVVVLRHIEATPTDVAMSLASRLSSLPADSPRVTATFTSASGMAATPEHQRLVVALGGVHVHIAPLRERSEDIPLVAAEILRGLNSRNRKLAPSALYAFVRAPWPGNILQMRATLLSIGAHVSGEIQATHLPADIQACATRRQLTNLERVELRAILDALKHANGNKVVAARIVGVSRSTLYRKLNSYRIDPDADYF